MKTHLYKLFVVLAVLTVMSACTTMESKKEMSLYDRLGGKKAIMAVVNDFIVTDQVCMGSGGPCEYKGRSMKETHKGLGITGDEFNYVVDDLVKTLDKYKVLEKEKSELLAILRPMQPDIVEVKKS